MWLFIHWKIYKSEAPAVIRMISWRPRRALAQVILLDGFQEGLAILGWTWALKSVLKVEPFWLKAGRPLGLIYSRGVYVAVSP